MPTFRNRLVIITAIQYTGENLDEIWNSFGTEGIGAPGKGNPECLLLSSASGSIPIPAYIGDWIIPDYKPNTYYTCRPFIFDSMYEPYSNDQSNDKTRSISTNNNQSNFLTIASRRELRIKRLKQGDWSFGHMGQHHGVGTKDCPKHLHHHCDEFCDLPTKNELQLAGIDPSKFKARSRA